MKKIVSSTLCLSDNSVSLLDVGFVHFGNKVYFSLQLLEEGVEGKDGKGHPSIPERLNNPLFVPEKSGLPLANFLLKIVLALRNERKGNPVEQFISQHCPNQLRY
jgi:hypothetical protein